MIKTANPTTCWGFILSLLSLVVLDVPETAGEPAGCTYLPQSGDLSQRLAQSRVDEQRRPFLVRLDERERALTK